MAQSCDQKHGVDKTRSFEIKPKYSNFLQKITKSAQKVAQQMNVKSYKRIDKTIEQQQKKQKYSLSTNNIQQIEDNVDQSDADDEWMEIVITKKPKQPATSVNAQNMHKNDNPFIDLERKSYLDTIQSLNTQNDELLQRFNQLKQKLNKNNEWQCNQCTLIQTINNNQCTVCKSKNPSFDPHSSEKQTIYQQKRTEIAADDYKLALVLQHEYKTTNDDEKLALELQKMEEKNAQNMRNQMRNVNRYDARHDYGAGIGNILMHILGVPVPVNNYIIANNNNYMEEKEINGMECEWKRLPTRSLTRNDVSLLQKVDGEGNKSCPICMLDFKNGDESRQLPCFHLFHRQCIDIWFQQQNDKGNAASCPLDRKKIIDAVQQTF